MTAPVALITGAGRGIGAATARKLSAEGWRLVLLDACKDLPVLAYPLARPDELEALVKACGGPRRALGVHGDVRRQDELDAAVAVAVRQFGGLDAAVAAAGCIGGGDETWNVSDDLWDTMVGVNLEGVWRLARATVPAMLARPQPRSGRFVAVASAGATVGLPLLSAYSAAKHGVLGLIRSLSAELGPLGITANAVAPGSTRTRMLEATVDVYGLDSLEDLAVRHRLGRIIEPEEVAAIVAWLCGLTSGAMTGAVVAVDAGMTAS